MPIQVVKGVLSYIKEQLNVEPWDGEVPRYSVDGTPIVPGTDPKVWPIVKVFMPESGFGREDTTEDPYYDEGDLTVQVWGTTRAQVEDPTNGAWQRIEALLAQASNWKQIPLGGPAINPFYVVRMQLTRWYSGQEEGVRTADGLLLYRGDLHYRVWLHGIISSY